MCAIVGSFDPNVLIELVKANQHRGNFSFSYMRYNVVDCAVVDVVKKFGVFDDSVVGAINDRHYHIAHVQAPTGGLIADESRIHPYQAECGAYVYHNGILKASYMDAKRYSGWDTKLLADEYLAGRIEEVSGSFACLAVLDSDVRVFRNAVGTLFVNDSLDISSVHLPGFVRIKAGVEYRLDFADDCLTIVDTFKDSNANYFFL